MRSDAIGLFWQDTPRKKGQRARVMPPIPETGWTAPTEFPNLKGAKALCIDVETYDPHMKKRGPGWARGDGHICGIAVGTIEGDTWYFPMKHEVCPEENMDPEHVLAWAKDNLTDRHTTMIGANITYDVGWLRQEGVRVCGPLFDVTFAEALLREERKVGLDSLGDFYLGEGKTGEELYEWCSAFYGGNATAIQRKNLYRAPPSLVGPYAEGDVDLPVRVAQNQWPMIEREGLAEVLDMENKLIYLLIEMRFQGVHIDLDRVEQLRDVMSEELERIDREIKEMLGFSVNVDSSDDLKRAFAQLGLQWGRTKKGNASFDKVVMEKADHPFTHLVLDRRGKQKLKGTFLESYLLESHVDSKVYGMFNQLRSDSGGARSGRFSSSTPNLQNIPSRTALGKQVRTAFVPDPGHERWIKADYSQIEYRALAHYAVGPGSDGVRQRYREDPLTDFHSALQTIIREVAGLALDRSSVKTINFGTAYGMGEKKLARDLGLTRQKAKELFADIHKAAPFMRATMDECMEIANRTGHITTIMGRRSRFNLWVPEQYDEDAVPLPWEQAMYAYPSPQRAYLHKALNRRLQGSAADLIKMAMLKCWEAGYFDVVGVPRLTVHDELDFSDPGGHQEVWRDIFHTMENAIRFDVPVIVDVEYGPNWGEVE